MEINLNKLSKEDLIKCIAKMHDTIEYWDNGFGLSVEDSDMLNSIGSACLSKCYKSQDFKINV